MTDPASPSALPWASVAVDDLAALLGTGSGEPPRWWLSGGAALDRWLGRIIRPREGLDVSTTSTQLPALIAVLPATHDAWVVTGDTVRGWDDARAEEPDLDVQHVLIRDVARGAWAAQVHAEDGTDRAWLYRRDARLQLPWDRAVREIDGIPTGAPEVQLLWKALRPRPEDDVDKDAVLPELSEEARAWWERALMSIHPHSTWAIHVRSPLTPAKASWNRPGR